MINKGSETACLATTYYEIKLFWLLSTRRIWIVPVTVSTLDLAIEPMNHKFCFLILTDSAAGINGLLFRVIMTADALSSAPLNVPTTIRVWNNVMS